jgi:hypothetical protein
MKPRVFVGSSSEGVSIANAIQENLQGDAYCDVWTQGIFGLGQTTIDALLDAVTDHDFGIFVLSPDDIQLIRSDAYSAPRDNVLLESALFMGRYAKDRAYLVKPMGVRDFRIPTDLLGVIVAEYDPDHFVHNPVAALGAASHRIRAAIRSNTSYNRNLTFNILAKREEGLVFPLKLLLQIRNRSGVDCVIRSHHFLCNRALRAARNAAGNPSTGEYEIKFPACKGDNLVFEYLLADGDKVTTWFPFDTAHTDAEMEAAIKDRQSGEFHYTCYWLGPTSIARRYIHQL